MEVEFSRQVTKLLNNLAKKNKLDKTEIIRRAIGLYAYLHHTCHNTDNTIAVMDQNDKILSQLKWM